MTWARPENPNYERVRIEQIVEEAAEVKTFVLSKEYVPQYKAGQFLTLVFADTHGEARRSYSLSSSPAVDDRLSFTVKRVPNGKYSRPLIDNLCAGDVLAVTGVAGQFVLPENINEYRQIFLFAAGIGITPVYSLLKQLLYFHPVVEVILIYSNSSVADTVFYQELLALHQQFPNQLRLEFLFSSSVNLSKARLSKWLLPQILKTYSREAKNRQLFYTCGPFAYMRMVVLSLEEQGYDSQQIKKENFDNSRPVRKIAPPDELLHQVTIRLKNKVIDVSVQYPQTILQAAKQAGIILPYSCETGRCGSCVMHCIKGKVWMSYNEVLTEKDIASGKVLTCVGHPVFGDVVLE